MRRQYARVAALRNSTDKKSIRFNRSDVDVESYKHFDVRAFFVFDLRFAALF